MRSPGKPGTTVGLGHSDGRRTLNRTVRWNEIPGQARDDGRFPSVPGRRERAHAAGPGS
ncbi:protein of unknown function [Micropruina glycogenica]|uniref:Uncharacterized protein n=1 Tax=Micropruina glycogenica TaxID=75385 RepID=A0A2N9JAF6_9ACTN|nr:protein of unknown function [Micropruina glycogenica]